MLMLLDTGFSSRAGAHDGNRSSCLVVVPHAKKDEGHGALLTLATGLAGRPGADQATREAIQSLNESYYATPGDWGLKHALKESIQAVHQMLLAGTGAERGRAAALSALVLRGRHWVIGHVGTGRVWRLRGNELKLLTHDHIAPAMGRRSHLHNACGLNKSLAIDLTVGELAEGDVFALTSGGVHNKIDSATIMGCLLADAPAHQMAQVLTQRALAAGSRETVSACVARVEKLPRESPADREEDMQRLPVIAPPAVGEQVDDFVIQDLLTRGSHSRWYKALDNESGKSVVLKFPNPKYSHDPVFAEHFLRAEWLDQRLNSSYLVRVLPLRRGRRTALYSVLTYHGSENLSARIRRKGVLSVPEALFMARQILLALEHMHGKDVVHGDIRPKNLQFDKKNKRLFLSSPAHGRVAHRQKDGKVLLGSKSRRSYLAPELFADHPAGIASDIYAAGVTLYHMLTGKYPYGKVQLDHPQGDFISPTRYKADIPVWLVAALRTACALDATERFQSAADFTLALTEESEQKSAYQKPMPTRQHVPKQWEWMAAIAMGAVLLIYLVSMLA